ncbi:NAD(P)-dependent alcohol dehydrogenase [Corticibacter populi]|uniref:NAD(P)-dependent alcohol dehydrogenase n=1 Tax=Corticibacter populi TaxID=1550736 RepID=A0A3M6QUF2_9BURK|nr:NAD(P)-dependent alcohol dehydrogenase [Corticibacter populi]RMX06656.1 NAD(P)-dependent alcohol dehydrogenase [Corticibacter populi]RZS31770.1 putative zinc-type alcohol dehydrogenase-like protein [Corticibacter populi]
MSRTHAYAAEAADAALAPFAFEAPALGDHDVRLEVLYCGVCHSDLHAARNDWGATTYPIVPGHEVIGRVVEAGANVTRHRIGDVVGVGCMADSCRVCRDCQAGLQQYCRSLVWTYDSLNPKTGQITRGGYASAMVVDEAYVLRIPPGLDLAGAAPLLCAGVTTWSPLREWQVGPGMRVGVVGLGGLGHMAVKLASALGAEVALITTSPGKAADARRLGASAVVVSTDKAQMKAQAEGFDFILDTVSAEHDLNPLLSLLRRDGTLVLLGIPPENQPPIRAIHLTARRKRLAGSLIGSIAETQDMLDFCAAHGITADVEVIAMDAINTAYERMLRSDVKYRFVIDMATLAHA